MARLPRLLFLFHLAAAIYRLEHSERVHPGVARLAIITSFIAYVIHLLACLWFFVGGYVQGWQEGLQEDAWAPHPRYESTPSAFATNTNTTASTSTCTLMACTSNRYESTPMLEKYVYSFWWSVTTLVGKGLVFQPQTTIEQVCS